MSPSTPSAAKTAAKPRAPRRTTKAAAAKSSPADAAEAPAAPARLTLEAAEAVVAAAKAEAQAIGQPMNIAVVDAGGHLVAFARMDGSIFASIDISQRKAYTSAAMKLPTGALKDVTQPGAPLYGLEHSSGGLVTFAGGIPLPGPDGEPVGAIGVSAGTVDQDQQVAEAGVAAWTAA
nr:heme-binding protein [Patulibacter americanus]